MTSHFSFLYLSNIAYTLRLVPPERTTFFRLREHVYENVGISLVKVYILRVGKSVTAVCGKDLKGLTDAFYGCEEDNSVQHQFSPRNINTLSKRKGYAIQRGWVTAVQFILFYFANYSPSIAMGLLK